MICKNCNEPLQAGAKFCTSCGAEVTETEQQRDSGSDNTATTITSSGNYSGNMVKSKTSKSWKLFRNIIIGVVIAGIIAIVIWVMVDPTAKDKIINAAFGVVIVLIFIFWIRRTAKKGKFRKSSDNYDYNYDDNDYDTDYGDDD